MYIVCHGLLEGYGLTDDQKVNAGEEMTGFLLGVPNFLY